MCQGECFSGKSRAGAISSPGRSRAHPYQRPLRRDKPFSVGKTRFSPILGLGDWLQHANYSGTYELKHCHHPEDAEEKDPHAALLNSGYFRLPQPARPVEKAKATVTLHELECTSLCAQMLGALPTCLLTAIKNEMWGCCDELIINDASAMLDANHRTTVYACWGS